MYLVLLIGNDAILMYSLIFCSFSLKKLKAVKMYARPIHINQPVYVEHTQFCSICRIYRLGFLPYLKYNSLSFFQTPTNGNFEIALFKRIVSVRSFH